MKEINQVLLFGVGDSMYAIDSDEVMQILRVPHITKIPLCDEAISGLCHIEGSVLPVFDVEKLVLGLENEVERSCEKARMLTIKNEETRFALLVKEVYSNININSGEIKFSDDKESSGIMGVLRYKEQIVQIIDSVKLLSDVKRPHVEKREISDGSRSATNYKKGEMNLQKYLFFALGDERFAINSELVREIIVPSLEITHIADAPKEMLGVITLRDEINGVIEFAQVFGKKRIYGEQNRIIIVQSELGVAGLYVDYIIDIRDIAESALELLPGIYNHGKFKGVFMLDGKLVSIIDDKVVHAQIEKAHIHGVSESKKEMKKEPISSAASKAYIESVIFFVGNNEYAFEMANVQEIIRYTKITKLPGAPKYLIGMINLRGRVIPVLSLHERLGALENINDDTKILVCTHQDSGIGFVVDAISEVRDIYLEQIKECKSNDEMLSGTVMLDDRIVQILSIDNYLVDKSLNFEGILGG